jgi:hypothetical protein
VADRQGAWAGCIGPTHPTSVPPLHSRMREAPNTFSYRGLAPAKLGPDLTANTPILRAADVTRAEAAASARNGSVEGVKIGDGFWNEAARLD